MKTLLAGLVVMVGLVGILGVFLAGAQPTPNIERVVFYGLYNRAQVINGPEGRQVWEVRITDNSEHTNRCYAIFNNGKGAAIEVSCPSDLE